MVDKLTLMKMHQELDELDYRTERLRDFMSTEKFLACPIDYRCSCYEQLNAMNHYRIALDKRLAYLEKDGEQ